MLLVLMTAIPLLAMSVVGTVVYAVTSLDAEAIAGEKLRAVVALEVVLADDAALDARTAGRLANEFMLQDARLITGGDADAGEVTIAVPQRPDLQLAWTPLRLGSKMFAKLAPLRIAVSVIFLGLVALLLWRLFRLTEELERRRRAAQLLANQDALTGLANRLAFDQRLGEALGAPEGGTALLYLDLDGFKQVNDSMGHGAGDELLRVVAGRLADAVREDDLVARIGGDEFGVVLPWSGTRAALAELAEELVLAVAMPVEIGTKTITIGASIGIALAPPQGGNAVDLLLAADRALYRAKAAAGRGTAFADETCAAA